MRVNLLPDAYKFCPGCETFKDTRQDFHRSRTAKDGRQVYCSECRTRRYREARAADREGWHAKDQANAARNHASKRWVSLKHRMGVTREDYYALLEQQGGGCAGCGRTTADRAGEMLLDVDHDHVTGAVRGLLCRACNRALGLVGDDPERMERLAGYLRASRRRRAEPSL